MNDYEEKSCKLSNNKTNVVILLHMNKLCHKCTEIMHI